MEEWRIIDWIGGKYVVSNAGRIKTVKTNKIRKLIIGTTGYPSVSLYGGSKIGCKKTYFKKVHKLVAVAFLPNPNNFPVVNHINGIKTDNRVQNLEWVTHKMNTQHAINSLGKRQGTIGTGHPNAVLNDDKVKTIWQLSSQGYSQRKIAALVGAKRWTVRNVLDGKQWTHV